MREGMQGVRWPRFRAFPFTSPLPPLPPPQQHNCCCPPPASLSLPFLPQG